MGADNVELIAYMKALVSEVHDLRREQIQLIVRVDDIRSRLEKALAKGDENYQTGEHRRASIPAKKKG